MKFAARALRGVGYMTVRRAVRLLSKRGPFAAVRRLARVRLHVDLTILAKLASALLAERT